MLRGPALDSAIRSVFSRPHRDTFFRAIRPKYFSDPLGRNRPINAQRFNFKNGARVLYLGEDQMTCLQEVQAFGFPSSSVTIVPVEVNLKAVVDLRDPNVRATLQLTVKELEFNFRTLGVGSAPALAQELGETAAASGSIDGFLYESLALRGKTNLAVFESNLSPLGSSVAVNDPKNNLFEKLP